MRRVGVLLAALLVTATACTGTPDRQRAEPAPAPDCPISTVHHSRPPSAIPGFTPRASGLWMGDERFAAVLFHARGDSPDIPVGGQWPDGRQNSKILWWSAGASDLLTVHGTEARTARQFTQTFDGLGGGQYPSIGRVPAPGCWTLAASVAGHRVGAVTVRAVQ